VSVAVGQVLEGVPDASCLRLVEVDGRRVVMLGARALFAFQSGRVIQNSRRDLSGIAAQRRA
jgi:hypothetical protein